jgi:hypothetical protein
LLDQVQRSQKISVLAVTRGPAPVILLLRDRGSQVVDCEMTALDTVLIIIETSRKMHGEVTIPCVPFWNWTVHNSETWPWGVLPIGVVEAQQLPTRPTPTGCLPVDENVAWALSSKRWFGLQLGFLRTGVSWFQIQDDSR